MKLYFTIDLSADLSENGLAGADDSNVVRKMRFSFKLGSCVVVMLHEDIIAPNTASVALAAPTVQELRNVADFFFTQVGLLSLVGAGGKDLSSVKEKLNSARSKSHLR